MPEKSFGPLATQTSSMWSGQPSQLSDTEHDKATLFTHEYNVRLSDAVFIFSGFQEFCFLDDVISATESLVK
jgi:hypothetical protein